MKTFNPRHALALIDNMPAATPGKRYRVYEQRMFGRFGLAMFFTNQRTLKESDSNYTKLATSLERKRQANLRIYNTLYTNYVDKTYPEIIAPLELKRIN